MKATKRRGPCILALALISAAFIPGCTNNLFNEQVDRPQDSKIDKYWDGDSAIKTTETRKKASEMGFGYPTGNGQ